MHRNTCDGDSCQTFHLFLVTSILRTRLNLILYNSSIRCRNSEILSSEGDLLQSSWDIPFDETVKETMTFSWIVYSFTSGWRSTSSIHQRYMIETFQIPSIFHPPRHRLANSTILSYLYRRCNLDISLLHKIHPPPLSPPHQQNTTCSTFPVYT